MKNFKRFAPAAMLTTLLLAATAHAFNPMDVAKALVGTGAPGQSQEAPAAGQIETAFSPDGGAEALVVRTIQSAKKSIRLAAYSFTSPVVVRALLDAKRRGVDVMVVVDRKSNLTDGGGGKSKAALNLLVNADIPVRTVSAYAIHHDKFIVADQRHVETGSFNYSDAAARRNSENVIVIWNNPDVAAAYTRHWNSRYEQGIAYTSAY